jgi:hypothetical protein
VWLRSSENREKVDCIYTDTSAIEGGKGIGVGLVENNYSLGNSYISHKTSLNIGSGQLVYNRELEGVTLAIEHASRVALPEQQIHIYSDN